MSNIQTLERLNVPLDLSDQNGIYVESRQRFLVVREIYEYRRNPVTTVREKKLISRVIEAVEEPITNPQKAMALNFLSEKLNTGNYVLVNPRRLRKEGSTKIIEVGYLAGQQVWFMGGTIDITDTGYRQQFDSIYRNIDRNGNPTSGVVSLPVHQEHRFILTRRAGKVVTETVNTTFAKVNQTFTKEDIESWGYNSDELAQRCWKECIIQRPSEETHLLNVATDLEPLGDNIFWPNVYLNGKDDNTFDFQKLIPHYATRTPDFVVRIRAYDTRTNADYPGLNYAGMGNAGKCMDLPFENESVKPIRIQAGSNFGLENNEDELLLTFNLNAARAAIGIAIEYKPLDGKKVDTEMYFDLITGKRTLNIQDLYHP
jgi:hypothetical protein